MVFDYGSLNRLQQIALLPKTESKSYKGNYK